MAKLSVVVITYNEERNIERCLKSVQWADEVIVVDSFSTDRTVELLKKYPVRLLQHEYDGEVTQRERGFAIANGDWLYWLDADEEIRIDDGDIIFIPEKEPSHGWQTFRETLAVVGQLAAIVSTVFVIIFYIKQTKN